MVANREENVLGVCCLNRSFLGGEIAAMQEY